MALPQILAGPILRRVEPASATVWMAFSKPQQVSLYIWEDTGIKTIPANQTGVFKPNAADRAFRRENVATRAIGKNLHVAAVTVEAAFVTKKIYSYNIVFKDDGSENDLRTSKLLDDTGGERIGVSKVPLGYQSRQLPSFVLPAETVADLVIAHCSCRKIHGPGKDALAHLDQVIKDNLISPQKRLQQLFMTGDQIYADEMSSLVLFYLNGTANELMGKPEFMRVRLPFKPPDDEMLPADAGDQEAYLDVILEDPTKAPEDAPCKLDYFPPVLRGTLVNLFAGYTTTSGENHLLSFGEFCAAYLYAWSPDVWPDSLVEHLKKLAEDKLVEDFDFFALKSANPYVYKAILEQLLNPLDDLDALMANATLTPRMREILLPKRQNNEDNEERQKWISEFTPGLEKETRRVCDFLRTLPKVRRVLANVPVMMIFDDHEVTDDWNLNMRWCNRVYTRPLGVDITRNALMAYTVFQDWGNSPAAYAEAGGVKAGLLELIERAGTGLGNDGRISAQVKESLHTLFRMDRPTNGTPDPPGTRRVTWHYSIKTGPATTFFLDTRTHRSYAHLHAFPILISEAILDQQLPDPDPDKLPPLVFIVSAVPLQSPAILEEQAQPILGGSEVLTNKEGIGGEAPGIVSAWLQRDLEAWGFNPAGHDLLLRKLAKFKHTVLLSGDVHYGFSTVTDYWTGNDINNRARIIQLTSSGAKNCWDRDHRLFMSGFVERLLTGFDSKVEKHVWRDQADKVKVSGHIPPENRGRLRRRPVIFAAYGWSEGSLVEPAPEARWRMTVQADERLILGDELFKGIGQTGRDIKREWADDPDLPLAQGVAPFEEAKDPQHELEVFKAIAGRHQQRFAKGLTRRLVWPTHVAIVDFEDTSDRGIVLRHRFLYTLMKGDKPVIRFEQSPLVQDDKLDTDFHTEHHIPLNPATEVEKTPPANLGSSNGN